MKNQFIHFEPIHFEVTVISGTVADENDSILLAILD